MAIPGFWYASGPRRREKLEAAASQTIAIGDLVKWSSGYVAIATSTDDHLLGVAESAVSNSSQGDAIYVNTHPDSVYRAYCSGTLTAAMRGSTVDMEGATGAQYVNENASTEKVLQIIKEVSSVGASVELFCKIARHSSAGQAGDVLNKDMAADSIDSDQYVDGSIDTAHLAADCVTGAKIADDEIDSEHLAAGSIDSEHLAANSIDSAAYVDKSIDPEHTADVSSGGDGFPLVAYVPYTDAGTVTMTMTRKCRVIDFYILCTNATDGTAKLTDTDDNDITDAITHGTTDNAIGRASTIDDAHYELAAGETLKLVSTGASSAAIGVVVLMPVA